jgi:predicted AlkP superfamily phosphohydrolase/phosphomutase
VKKRRPRKGITRRSFLARTSLVLAPLAIHAGIPGKQNRVFAAASDIGGKAKGGRVVILGFDGVEPTIIDGMLKSGALPNLLALQTKGNYQRLLSSNPPQSPTAWSSFATCKRPGNHGIYDFLRRNPETYVPGLGFGAMKSPQLAADGSLLRPAEYVNYRKGETFWAVANRQGVRCKLLNVPYAYPPEPLLDSAMLCGLDVPDVRGTQSTFFAFSDTFSEVENVAGGVRLPLKFEGEKAVVQVPGLRHPSEKRLVEVPMTVVVDREKHTMTLDIQGRTLTLSEHTWSEWIEWAFPVTPKFTVRAISRIHVIEAGAHVRMYMTCLQIHPKEPYLPISAPGDYAGRLADRYGLFKTVGWTDDTKALQQGELDETLFLEEAWKTMGWQESLVLDELGAGSFDLLIAGWTSTDRIAHMFWRFRDPKHPKYSEAGAKTFGRAIEDAYGKMDATVGKVTQALNEDDLLIVLSDHGFHGFRKGFSVNTWLIRNGYLAVAGQTNADTAFNEAKYLEGYDWSRSQAYGLGLGSIFLNLEGREGQGILSPEDAPALMTEIKERLMGVTDAESGAKIFGAVYTRDQAYRGSAAQEAPDLQLGYAEGYQTDKPSAAGAAPKEVFSLNDDKWSGDHAASDVATTPGMFFSNRLLAENLAIIDIGVTTLACLGVDVPCDFEGVSLLGKLPQAAG